MSASPCRLLRDALEDQAWSRRYEQVLGALMCLCGAGLRAELDRQTNLVTLLAGVAERVRQAGGSARQVSVCVRVYPCAHHMVQPNYQS